MAAILSGISLLCFGASYAVAWSLELLKFLRRSGVRRLLMLLFVCAGFLAHTLYLGHRAVEFSATPCMGHCCGGQVEYGDLAWAFFQQHQRCGGIVMGEPGGSCASFGELP